MLGYDQGIDKLLDEVEAHLLGLAREWKVFGASITRWRWDEPNITLTWAESPVDKSLQVSYLEESDEFEVGISAWKDIDEPGDRRRRQWDGMIMGTTALADAYGMIDSAFRTLADWNEERLVNTTHLI